MKIVVTSFITSSPTKQPAPFYIKPDSCLIKGGKPFFIPSEKRWKAVPCIAIRIAKLGKSAMLRFAPEFCDTTHLGCIMTCEEDFIPAWETLVTDGSAVISDAIPPLSAGNFQFQFTQNRGANTQSTPILDVLPIYDCIQRNIYSLSQLFTWREGDFIFCTLDSYAIPLSENLSITGTFQDKQILNFHIK